MRVQPADVVDADVALKLLPRLSALLEEVGAEPDFLEVRLVRVLGEYLLDCYLPLGGLVDAEPDHAEPAPSQQPDPLEVLGEPVAELGVLVGSEEVPDVEALRVLVRLVVDVDGLFLVVLVVAGRVALVAAVVFLLLPLPFEQLF